MTRGFIFDWRRGDSAGRIRITSGPHSGDDAAFRLSECRPDLREFLQDHDVSSLSVTFDLIETPADLRDRNVNPV